jgi:hypothetical protein
MLRLPSRSTDSTDTTDSTSLAFAQHVVYNTRKGPQAEHGLRTIGFCKEVTTVEKRKPKRFRIKAKKFATFKM